MAPDAAARPWGGSTLVGVPAAVLAGTAFQHEPRPLVIAGVHEAHAGLFALLDHAHSVAEARELLARYMDLSFDLGPAPAAAAAPRRFRTGYRQLLQGWALDANGAAGAVFKGWAESRFGLTPTFHQAPLARFPSPAWVGYLEQKAHSRWHNHAIWPQLDLLYSAVQHLLQRLRPQLLPEADATHVRLWRGIGRAEEQVVAGRLRDRRCTLRLNSVVSFARTRDDAGIFGDWVVEARVPLVKLVVVPGVLSTRALDGENEVIALGGDLDVVAGYGP